nr:flagellar basal body rod protein FlgB [Desulforadius tongensis]
MALKRDLDVGTLRQRVIADNLANINTPGFKKSVVSFEEQLQRALNSGDIPLRATHPRHIGMGKHPMEVQPKVERVTNTSLRPDGNNVSIDEEMVNSAAVELKYNTSVQALNEYYSLISYVITASRR